VWEPGDAKWSLHDFSWQPQQMRAARLAPQPEPAPLDTDAWERVRLDALDQMLPVAEPRKPPAPAADENVVVRNQRNAVPAASKGGMWGGGGGKRAASREPSSVSDDSGSNLSNQLFGRDETGCSQNNSAGRTCQLSLATS